MTESTREGNNSGKDIEEKGGEGVSRHGEKDFEDLERDSQSNKKKTPLLRCDVTYVTHTCLKNIFFISFGEGLSVVFSLEVFTLCFASCLISRALIQFTLCSISPR